MKPYEINQMIIDDDFDSEEYVTVEFQYQEQQYSITFKKSDLEMINSWIYKDGHSLPARLPESVLGAIRDEIKGQID